MIMGVFCRSESRERCKRSGSRERRRRSGSRDRGRRSESREKRRRSGSRERHRRSNSFERRPQFRGDKRGGYRDRRRDSREGFHGHSPVRRGSFRGGGGGGGGEPMGMYK